MRYLKILSLAVFLTMYVGASLLETVGLISQCMVLVSVGPIVSYNCDEICFSFGLVAIFKNNSAK